MVAPKLMRLMEGLGRVAAGWVVGLSDSELLGVVGEVATARVARLRGRPIYRRHRRIRRRPFRISVQMYRCGVGGYPSRCLRNPDRAACDEVVDANTHVDCLGGFLDLVHARLCSTQKCNPNN